MTILTERSFSSTVWCDRILSGLKAEARKKRINLDLFHEIDPALDRVENGQIIIVGADGDFLQSAVTLARARGIHPIVLGNQPDGKVLGGVSAVSADLGGSMRAILSYLEGRGRKKAALYACNPNSLSDISRKKAFLESGGNEDDIFENRGSLAECFKQFYDKNTVKKYDGIVCANDFAAVSLIKQMREAGEDISDVFIISYSDTVISRCHSPSITSVTMNYESFGQLAFMISDCISKSEQVSGIQMQSSWQIIHRETTDTLPTPAPTAVTEVAEKKADGFYDDPELVDLMRLEAMLTSCDETDLRILSMILDDKKLSEIEEECFLAETAVKYRIKKMKECCHVSTRAELHSLISKYIPDKSALLKISASK